MPLQRRIELAQASCTASNDLVSWFAKQPVDVGVVSVHCGPFLSAAARLAWRSSKRRLRATSLAAAPALLGPSIQPRVRAELREFGWQVGVWAELPM